MIGRRHLSGETTAAEPAQVSRLPDSWPSRARVEPTLSAATIAELREIAIAHGRTFSERQAQFLFRAGVTVPALRARLAEPLPVPAEPVAVELQSDWPKGMPLAKFCNALAADAA